MAIDGKATARRMLEEPWNEGRLEAMDEILAPDYTAQTPFGEVHGPEAVKAIIGEMRNAFPDVQLQIEDQWAEGDTVITRWAMRGTHRGPLRGIEPTGKEVRFTGVLTVRFDGDRIVQGWQHFDRLTMLEQIGAVSAPAGATAG